jgi:hypothetical protein
MYNDIKDEAKRDTAAWNNPGDPDRGYQQLTTEQLPIRKDQLFNMYGPTGAIPLIPGVCARRRVLKAEVATVQHAVKFVLLAGWAQECASPRHALMHRPCSVCPLPADAQPGSFQLALGRLEPGPSGFIQVNNPNAFAVDISGYRLQGAAQFTFAPGGLQAGLGWARRQGLPARAGCLV